MRLSWNEIRARAATFADEWKAASYERGQTQTFYNEFFEVFGVKARRVATFEEPVKKLGDKRGYIDLFWKGVLLVEQKSVGLSLARARTQALDYFPGLKEHELPRYVLLSDFQTFELIDLETREESRFTLVDLPSHVEKFGFILGVEKRTFKDQDPVNILAAELMGKLHDALEASGYIGHDLERLLVRLLFCLFADDTGIFHQKGALEDLLVGRTHEDGTNTGQWLEDLFQVLNTPENRRQKATDADLAKFPYINGDLFAERLPIAHFDSKMRTLLLEACSFKWDSISPAIFGSLFQFVMAPAARRKEGAHYTNERCILKVIEPLFLDDIRIELAHIKGLTRDREARLKAFHDKLAGFTFFDPACGCGNFLVIAYRELREIELEILKELHTNKQLVLDVGALSKLNVEQFYGIELSEFPARIAEVALWMMDHIANVRLSLEFGQNYARIPLKQSPHIVHGDALELDWQSVLPAAKCSYIIGNPPFGGFVQRSPKQQEQLRRLGVLGSRIDYVAGWFFKAAAYVVGTSIHIGFVATNSLTQGEQVAQIWPLLFEKYELEITFAHRTFAWESEARGKAHVHVVILGLIPREHAPLEKRLFSYDVLTADPTESRHKALSPYLVDASQLADQHLVVERASESLSGAPSIRVGSKPVDGGLYIFDDREKDEFLRREPGAARIMRPFIGGQELINGESRWILFPEGLEPNELRKLLAVTERVAAVRKSRETAEGNLGRSLAATPTKYHVTVVPERSFLALPEVSSERRSYVPIAWLSPPTIPSNQALVIQDADLYHFGILTSRMHMAWLRHIGGRLKSDYRYSGGIVYNTFPWPEAEEKAEAKIRVLAQTVLDARAAHPGATLADLYDADLMPADLRRAHREVDAAVDKLYRPAPYDSDRARVEHLFALYEKIAAPLIAASRAKRKRKRP